MKHIEEAMNYQLEDKDIDVMLKEKERFKKRPHNMAMKKTHLLKEIEVAENEKNMKRVQEV